MAIAEAVRLAILGAVAWGLIVSGAALVGLGLLVRLVARFRRRLVEDARRGRAGALVLRLYLYLWLLAVAIWMAVSGLLLTPRR